MDRFQIEAVLREFPFLGPLVKSESVEEIKVSRISPELLDFTPKHRGATGICVNIDEREMVYLLDAQGAFVLEVKSEVNIRHNEANDRNEPLESREGETVGEALLRIEDPDTVVWAIKIHKGHHIEEHRSVGGYTVTVYKAPRGFTLKGWIEEQLQRARAGVKATIAEIDAEA